MKILLLLLPLFSGCFLKIVSSSFSKEFCSCYFVEKQGKQFCQEYATHQQAVSSYSIDEANKMITSKKWGHITRARWLSQRQGCQIVD